MDKYNSIYSDSFEFLHTLTQHPNQSDFFLHTHDGCELYYLMSGKGIFHIEGNDYCLKPGDILIMDNRESHYIELDCSHPYERFVVHFKKDYIRKIDTDGELLKIFEKRAPGENNLFRKEHFEGTLYLTLINNIISGIKSSRIQAETNFFALLNELLIASSNVNCDNVSMKNSFTSKIISYILENLEKQFTLDDICAEFYISKSQLCRMFKKTMGSTIWNYVVAKRISKAKEMIDSGNPPSQVYLQCGFLDYPNFYRAYKKFYGHSPTNRTRG